MQFLRSSPSPTRTPTPRAFARLAEAGRRLGPQCRKRIVADRGQLKREGALLLLLSCAPLRETFVGGDPCKATGLADVLALRRPLPVLDRTRPCTGDAGSGSTARAHQGRRPRPRGVRASYWRRRAAARAAAASRSSRTSPRRPERQAATLRVRGCRPTEKRVLEGLQVAATVRLHVVAVRCGAPLVVCVPEREASERPLVAPAARGERLGHVERHAVVRVPWVTVLKLAGHLNHECRVGGSDDRVALPRARLALRVPVGPGPPVAERKARLADRLSRRPRHGATS
eukprot:scaffold888_cov61-Phaeocystis_antarctica.AAC.4